MVEDDLKLTVLKALQQSSLDFDVRLATLFSRKLDDAGIYLSFYRGTLSEEGKSLLALITARYELMLDIFVDTLVNLKREEFF